MRNLKIEKGEVLRKWGNQGRNEEVLEDRGQNSNFNIFIIILQRPWWSPI